LRLAIALGVASCVAPACSRHHTSRSQEVARTLVVDGLKRSFLLHVPAQHRGPLPLVIVLHGGGGTARGMKTLTRGKFDELADREGFVVAYPDGVGKHWNDGRPPGEDEATREHVDDVAFLKAMIEAIGREVTIDPKRVFATGISNGGMMSHRLACDLSAQIAAIAPVVGALSPLLSEHCRPSRPVPVLAVNGTADPLVPYGGGQVHFGSKQLGEALSAPATVERWAKLDSCHSPSADSDLPDVDPSDGVKGRVHRRWRRGRALRARRRWPHLAGRRAISAVLGRRHGVPRLRRQRARLGVLPQPSHALSAAAPSERGPAAGLPTPFSGEAGTWNAGCCWRRAAGRAAW
jgi:polyhydroxybutyrate depolymerase